MASTYTKDFEQGENGQGCLLYAINVVTGLPMLCEADASGSLISITHEHSKVHQGAYYSAGHYFTAVADAATAELLVKVGSTHADHIVIIVGSAGNSKYFLYESPTLAGNGTSIPVVNHNRASANTSATTVFYTPTIGGSPLGYGDPLVPGSFFPGGSKDKGGGAIIETAGEQWIFAASTDYLIRVTNISGSAADISIEVAFYEVAV